MKSRPFEIMVKSNSNGVGEELGNPPEPYCTMLIFCHYDFMVRLQLGAEPVVVGKG